MKNKNWMWILVILGSVGAFFGYCALDALRTDSRPPEIDVGSARLEVSVEDPKSALTQGMTAADREDGDVTDSLVVESISMLDSGGTVSVTYAAFDAAGNVARAQREVKYSDYVGPRFVLKAPLIYRQGISFDVLSSVGAEDVLDGDIQHRVRATMLGEGSLSQAGTHMLRFQVTNSLGDTEEQVLPVEVLNEDLYDGELELSRYLVYLPAGSVFNPNAYLKSFTGGGKTISLESGIPSGCRLETGGQVQTQTPGTYSVEYIMTYTQDNGDSSSRSREYTGRSKLIVVVEG